MKRAKDQSRHQDADPNPGPNSGALRHHGRGAVATRRDDREQGAQGGTSRGKSKKTTPRARRQDPVKPQTPPAAFINIPFHHGYEREALAVVATLTCVGIAPRILPQTSQSRARYTKLIDVIRSCDYSLHDLSYMRRDLFVRTDGKRFRVPRQNPAYEAGIASTIATLGEQGIIFVEQPHQLYILEREPYRLQASLSDLTVDPQIHGGTVRGTILAVLEMFSSQAFLVTTDLVMKVYRRLSRQYRILQKTAGSLFNGYCFGRVVYMASRILGQLRGERSSSRGGNE